ncbi:hypothetical protein A1A1_11652 [Planococcus antarcticus DSM 14505]|uniref:DUF58 domain-containing protein n=1 Tax=Planococcus antarcticus DSM 14505 TaxID=1185653 RepID=A0A1C7DJI8_9BACL|nr:DUF58 domain-containing protein [Planococcus antarcticus]ANU11759.1 hypothetical protein BBH88_16640 [Planococcus antarcticus DSM 14505]EIM06383.1 hypothetical protein A1A1_11652 [Planococcus antarcticus DSM 14505]
MTQLKKITGLWGRLLLVLFILFLTFSFAMFQGGFVSWFIFYMVLPFILYSVLLTFYPLQDVEASRKIHTAQVRKGGSFSATATIYRKTSFPLLYTVLSEQTNSPSLNKRMAGQQQKMIVPGFRKRYSWTYAVDQMPRGEHVLEGVHLEISDFFGWVKKTHLLPVQQTLLVYPNTVDITYRPMESRYDQGSMAAPFTLVKDTTMASGIRDYQPGDRVSWIHWKSYARTQTLRTKEFEDRQSQELFLLDDRMDSEKFELQVELVASILQSIVRANSSVAYLSVGQNRNYFPLVQTEEHLQRVMYHLAKVQSDLDKPVDQAIGRELQQMNTSSLLYVTSQLSTDMIQTIRKNAKNLSNCMCLVVANKGETLLKEDEEVHQFARSKGFVVKRVSPENFATVFTEVSRQ